VKITEEIAIENVKVLDFGYTPKARRNPPTGKRRRKAVATDRSSRIALKLQAPLTRPIACMLLVEDLLFEHDSSAPHAGYKRITLDTDKILNVGVKVRDKDRNASLEIQADALEAFAAVDVKGVGPVIEWKMRTTGYMTQIADFAAVIEDYKFTIVFSPVQGKLFEKSTGQPAGKPQVYATN